MPTLERMIEDLEELGWFIFKLNWVNENQYTLELMHTPIEDDGSVIKSKFYTDGTVKEVFQEAWQRLV